MSIKTRVGKVVKVINQHKKKNSSSVYHSVMLKDDDGRYRPFMFIDTELDIAADRARKNVEDQVERSFISKLID